MRCAQRSASLSMILSKPLVTLSVPYQLLQCQVVVVVVFGVFENKFIPPAESLKDSHDGRGATLGDLVVDDEQIFLRCGSHILTGSGRLQFGCAWRQWGDHAVQTLVTQTSTSILCLNFSPMLGETWCITSQCFQTGLRTPCTPMPRPVVPGLKRVG